MALSLAQSAIALLIDLAERGDLDPWDVQVIDVIDRFLSELTPTVNYEAGRAPYEADLSQSGQAFLYASMLVLLKADTLARAETAEADAADLEDVAMLGADGLTSMQMPLNLERRLRRRAVAKPPQQRRVTLQELINQLELMATAMESTTPRPRTRRPRPQSRSQAVRAIAQLAHQENLSEIAALLEAFLANRWLEISQGQDWLDFDTLLELWPGMDEQPALVNHSPNSDRVGIFWALLFLSAQSKVELSQEEFYQDLKVRSLNECSAFALPE